MFLVTHPVGNQNVRELIKTLDKEGLLYSFHTSISFVDSRMKNILFPEALKRQLQRRTFEGVKSERIASYPFFDICRLVAQKIGFQFLVDCEKGILRPENLYKYFDKKTASYVTKLSQDKISSVYGYDAKCLETFRAAKNIGGINLYYEAAFGYTPYVAEILNEEREINPEWRSSIPVISERSISIQKEEIEMANHIIVASEFAKKSFYRARVNKTVSVIPYGAPMPLSDVNITITDNDNYPLRVIYIGVLSQQKGISYLFDAMSLLPADQFDLTLVGKDYSSGKNKSLLKELDKYTWFESAPHSQVLELMSFADVLVLPSIADAFGLVVLEALSRGTVVIVSDHCGASDVVIDKVNGFVIPIRNPYAIAQKLEVINKNRAMLKEMKAEAIKVAGSLTWGNYSSELLSILRA